MMPRLGLIAVIIAVAIIPLSAQPDTTERVAHLPDTNPYRAVAMRWLSLPENDRKAISEWLSPDTSNEHTPIPLDPAHQEIALAVAYELAAATKIGAAQPQLWPPKRDPKNPDNPFYLLIPDVGVMRELAQIATKVADVSPASDAIQLYAATARLGVLLQQVVRMIWRSQSVGG
jgi:hypothetical protein